MSLFSLFLYPEIKGKSYIVDFNSEDISHETYEAELSASFIQKCWQLSQEVLVDQCWLADLAVPDVILTGGGNSFKAKLASIAYMLTLSLSHCPDMTEILFPFAKKTCLNTG